MIKMENELTPGPVMKTMLRFAIPMILGDLLQQCYNIADTLIVGRFLGADALAIVYFGGDASAWSAVSVAAGNEPLKAAAVYFYKEEQPAAGGNFWHYVDGVPAVWPASEEV